MAQMFDNLIKPITQSQITQSPMGMIKTIFKLSLFISLLGAGIFGCIKAPEYANEPKPQIEFLSVTNFTVPDPFSGPRALKDSVSLTIGFKDGDGNLGFDRKTEKREDPIYGTWGNYELRTFKKVGTRFEEITSPINSKLFFPTLRPSGEKAGPIEGKLDFSQTFFRSNTARIQPIKFMIRIRDRANNVSNVVESDTISVPVEQ